MNEIDVTTLPTPLPTERESYLEGLVQSLRDQIENMARMRTNSDEVYATTLLRLQQESEARKLDLQNVLAEVERLKEKTKLVIHQRDTVEKALRALFNALPGNDGQLLKYFAGSELLKAHTETKELLSVIDGLKGKPSS